VFRRIVEIPETLTFTFDGRPMRATAVDSVATALHWAGVNTFRTTVVSREPRGPPCSMGVCFDCLVTIDDVANIQGCQVNVTEGMEVESQRTDHILDGSSSR
jgi:hypothetical protein